MKSLCSICALLSPLLIISCGSIVNGSQQSVGFSSSPDGATVSIDGMPRGRTPITIELERDEDHTVRTVSYTHLDVYKRQAQSFTAGGLISVMDAGENAFFFYEIGRAHV